MREFFDLEGPFFSTMTKLVDMVFANILFLVCCIPVVTIGASLSAFYYTTHKVIRRGRGYVGKAFFHSFKDNLKQSTIVWLIFLLITGLLSGECYLMYQYALSGEKIGRVYILLMILIGLVFCWGFYLFPYIARFQNRTKMILRNAVFFAVGNFPSTIVLALGLFFAVALILTMPLLVLVVPAVYMVVTEVVMEKIFVRYMTPEDIQAEQERDRIYYN